MADQGFKPLMKRNSEGVPRTRPLPMRQLKRTRSRSDRSVQEFVCPHRLILDARFVLPFPTRPVLTRLLVGPALCVCVCVAAST